METYTSAYDIASLHFGVKMQKYWVPSALYTYSHLEIIHQRITINGLYKLP